MIFHTVDGMEIVEKKFDSKGCVVCGSPKAANHRAKYLKDFISFNF